MMKMLMIHKFSLKWREWLKDGRRRVEGSEMPKQWGHYGGNSTLTGWKEAENMEINNFLRCYIVKFQRAASWWANVSICRMRNFQNHSTRCRRAFSHGKLELWHLFHVALQMARVWCRRDLFFWIFIKFAKFLTISIMLKKVLTFYLWKKYFSRILSKNLQLYSSHANTFTHAKSVFPKL